MEEKKTSSEWKRLVLQKYRLMILDPDGWDRKNFQYSFFLEKISQMEFTQRLSRSTIQCDPNLFTDIW